MLVEKGGNIIAVEIKSGKRIDPGMFAGIRYWKKNNPNGQGILMYGGERNEELSDGMQIMSWKEVIEM